MPFFIFPVVIDHARLPKADTGKFECVYSGPTAPHEAKNYLAPASFELSGNISSSRLPLNTQTKLMFSKSKSLLNSDSTFEPKVCDSKVLEELIKEPNVYGNKETSTFAYKTEPEVSVGASVSELDKLHSDPSTSDILKHSKSSNFMSLTSSNLLKKAHFAGTQFARLLLSYFLIYLQSITGISTLPSVILESQNLRDSLCSQMSSPSKFFATSTSGYDTETLG